MMSDRDRLAAATSPPGSGASFAATRHAGLACIEPPEPAADWLRRIVSDEASWDGDALVLEMRYFASVAEAAIAAEFAFERDALRN